MLKFFWLLCPGFPPEDDRSDGSLWSAGQEGRPAAGQGSQFAMSDIRVQIGQARILQSAGQQLFFLFFMWIIASEVCSGGLVFFLMGEEPDAAGENVLIAVSGNVLEQTRFVAFAVAHLSEDHAVFGKDAFDGEH